MESRASLTEASPRARWRLIAVLGAAGLLLAAALPSSASAQGLARMVGSKLSISYNGVPNSTNPVFALHWEGPSTLKPPERRFQVDLRHGFAVGGATMTGVSPCTGGFSGPFGPFARCPSGDPGSGTISSYEVFLPSCCTTSFGKASHFVAGSNPFGADFSDRSVAGIPLGDTPTGLNNISFDIQSGTITALDPQTCGSLGGGVAADTRGWDLPHRMVGARCDDVLRVAASSGNRLFGNDGDDHLIAYENGERDAVFCGKGFDRAEVDLRDGVRSKGSNKCEVLERAPKDKHPLVQIRGEKAKVAGGRATVKLKCPKEARTKRCKGKLTLKKGGSARYSIKRGKKKKVRVRAGGGKTVTAIAREKGKRTTTAKLKRR